MINNKYYICLVYLFSLISLPLLNYQVHASTLNNVFIKNYNDIFNSSWKIKPIGENDLFIFSMSGIPKDIHDLDDFVKFIDNKKLSNAFDPGPTLRESQKAYYRYLAKLGWPVISYPGCAEFQVANSNCKHHSLSGIDILDDSRVFNAIHFGEWGSYFHGLSSDERWFKDTYKERYSSYKYLLKNKELHGYDYLPKTKKECYEIIKKYFMERKSILGGKIHSVTGHSHYEAYSGEWGASIIGIELGVPAFTQSKIAFARASSRAYNIPWSIQVSPWLLNSVTTSSNSVTFDNGTYKGLYAGHSLSFYKRLWLHSWFAGAAMLTPENGSNYLIKKNSKWELTRLGENAVDLFKFMREHDRGIPYTPATIIIDHLNGYNPYEGKPWGILNMTRGDKQLYNLLEEVIYPNAYNIRDKRNPNNPEANYLVKTPYGEIFDVNLSNLSQKHIKTYPLIILAGDMNYDNLFIDKLLKSIENGSVLMVHNSHHQFLENNQVKNIMQSGKVFIYTDGNNDNSFHNVFSKLINNYLPIKVEGNGIQYQINSNKNGWVVELINNNGVTKRINEPQIIDAKKSIGVYLEPKIAINQINVWKSGGQYTKQRNGIYINVPPGEVVYLEFKITQ